MINLFIDTSNNKLVYILEKDSKLLGELKLDNQKRISDIAIDELKKLLESNGLSIHDIKNIYVTKGPGSYTGVRVGITIAKTLKTINDNYKVFTLSSLAFQAGLDDIISTLDARGDKVYFGVYSKGTAIIADQVLPNEMVSDLSKPFERYQTKKDFEELDFFKNYIDLKDLFHEETNVADIEPVYIKSFM